MKNNTKQERVSHFELIENLLKEISPEEQKLTDRKMLLAVRIDEAMKSKGIKKGQLAQMLGKRPSEVTKWLSGTHNFTVETLWEIGDALGIDLIFLKDKPERIIYIAHAEVSSSSAGTYQNPWSLDPNVVYTGSSSGYGIESN